MAFTHDPSTDEGVIRSLIFDTDATSYDFEDDEITAILDKNNADVWAAASDLCRSLAAKYTKNAVNLNLGKYDIVIDTRKKAEFYMSLARQYSAKTDSSNVVEYIDRVDYHITDYGYDTSEYVGED